MANDTANYLGQQRFRVRQLLNATGSVTMKTCPPPQGTALDAAGVADAGGTTTTMVDAARTEATDVWTGRLIRFTSGTNKNLVRRITAFNPATDTMTWSPAVNAAVGAGDTYELWMETTNFNHLVVTGYSVSGNNANAAFTTWLLRHVDGNKEVLVGGSMGLTSGSCNKDNSNCWYEMIPSQSLELVVGGSLTGQIDVTVEGRILPMSTTSTDFLDGAAH